MDWINLIQTFGVVAGTLGGYKIVEVLFFREPKKQIMEAEADTAEEKAKGVAIENDEKQFSLLTKQLELAQQQNVILQEAQLEKEKRFQEETEVVRDLTSRLLEATAEIGKRDSRISSLEAERSMKLCERRGCLQREPQSDF